ncbi:MAG: serine acetyltransferase [Oscillospiraceae bacterium]|nr:serine acetyltransferase [Oscillospiraceae bacterium]
MVLKNKIPKIFLYLLYNDNRIRHKANFLIKIKKANNYKLLQYIIRESLRKKNHIIIGKNSKIGSLKLPHPHNVVIGDCVQIGENCTLYHDVTLGQNLGKFPQIGDNVIIYTGAKVIGNVTVGNNAVIGANAVVVDDVPDNAIVAGNPASIIRHRKEQDEFY